MLVIICSDCAMRKFFFWVCLCYIVIFFLKVTLWYFKFFRHLNYFEFCMEVIGNLGYFKNAVSILRVFDEKSLKKCLNFSNKFLAILGPLTPRVFNFSDIKVVGFRSVFGVVHKIDIIEVNKYKTIEFLIKLLIIFEKSSLISNVTYEQPLSNVPYKPNIPNSSNLHQHPHNQ